MVINQGRRRLLSAGGLALGYFALSWKAPSMTALLARIAANHRATGSPWTPTDLSVAPAIWLNDTSTVTDDGTGHCSLWSDISGGARDFSISTSDWRPAITAAGLNGLRVITFDGVDDLLQGNTAAQSLTKSIAALSTFILANPSTNASTTPKRLINFSIGLSTNTSTRAAILLDTSSIKAYQRRLDSDAAKNAAIAHASKAWRIHQAEHNWTAQTVALRLDGGTATTTNTAQGSGTTSATNSTEVAIGGTVGTSGQFSATGVAELIVLGYIPTTDERQRIEGYLAWKWGLQGNLPSDHPYKSAAPTGTTPATLTTAPTISTSDTGARISFRADKACNAAIKYSTASDLSGSTTTSAVALASGADFTGKVDLSGLSAATTYYYTVLLDGVDQLTAPYPHAKTLPAAGSPAAFSFAFGSCTTHASGSDAIFGQVPSGASFLLHLGDTIYADSDSPTATTLADYRTKRRSALVGADATGSAYKVLRASLPVLSMWDDHDLTNDFSAGTGSALYAPAKQSFQEYPGRSNPDPATAGELYYTFQVGDVGFFVPDLRSYRSANTATDDSSKTILGATQKAALKSWLLANKTALKFKFICCSVPAHGYASNTAGDSWGGVDDSTQAPNGANGFRTERNELWDYIDANGITGVIFISGDQHWAGAFKTTYASRPRYEFMASPFNQSMLTPVSRSADAVNGPVFWKYGAGDNFGVVTVDTTASPATVSFQLYGTSGSLGSSYLTALTSSDIDTGL